MRSNPVKERIKSGEAVYGTMIFEFFTPGIAQICKAAGAEFVLFDMEHSGIGLDVIKAQMAACRGIGIVPMVRVPVLQSHFIARCLDMGAHGRVGRTGPCNRDGRALPTARPAWCGLRRRA